MVHSLKLFLPSLFRGATERVHARAPQGDCLRRARVREGQRAVRLRGRGVVVRVHPEVDRILDAHLGRQTRVMRPRLVDVGVPLQCQGGIAL